MPDPATWQALVRPSENLLLEDFDIFARGIAIYGKESRQGQPRLALLRFGPDGSPVGEPRTAQLPAWARSLEGGANVEFCASRGTI